MDEWALVCVCVCVCVLVCGYVCVGVCVCQHKHFCGLRGSVLMNSIAGVSGLTSSNHSLPGMDSQHRETLQTRNVH